MALIDCSECGKQVSDKAPSCPNCGNPINNKSFIQSTSLENSETDLLYCPKCKSSQLSTNKKGFSGGKALTGAVLTGGIGLLAGTIGSGKVIITCLKCGYKFKAGEYEKEKQKFEREKHQKEQQIKDYTKKVKQVAEGEKSLLSFIFPQILMIIILLISTSLSFTYDADFFGYICIVAILVMVVLIFSTINDVTKQKKDNNKV